MKHRIATALLLALFGPLASRADEVDGFGRTLDDAKIDARQHALEQLLQRQANCEPPLTAWKPTLADIEGMLENNGRAGPSVHVEPLGIQHNWKINLRFPTENELRLRDRQSRRQSGAAVAAGVAVAGMACWWAVANWRGRRRQLAGRASDGS